MKKSFVVIGCGRFGSSVAKNLYNFGYDVLVIDKNLDVINDIADSVTQAIKLDVLDENALKSIGLNNYDVAIVSFASQMEASVIATILIKELGVPKIICKAKDELQGKVLTKIGADKIVYPERDMGEKLAYSLTSGNILDFIDLDPDYSIIEISILDNWIGKTITTLNLRNKYRINIIAIKRNNSINISPAGEDILLKDDILIILGKNSDLNRLSI